MQIDILVDQVIVMQEYVIDKFGEGLFGWVSLYGIGSLVIGVILLIVGILFGDLFSKVDGVVFGVGSVDGYGYMQLCIYVLQLCLFGYFVLQQFDFSFDIVGVLCWVVNVVLFGVV